MKFARKLIASATTLLLTAGPLAAMPLIQDPPVQVDVTTTETTRWYADPVWLAIGGVVLLVIIALAVMAGRGGERGGTTTVVR